MRLRKDNIGEKSLVTFRGLVGGSKTNCQNILCDKAIEGSETELGLHSVTELLHCAFEVESSGFGIGNSGCLLCDGHLELSPIDAELSSGIGVLLFDLTVKLGE